VTSAAQTRAIHAMRRALGMTDADYRGLLQARFRVVSSTDLDAAQAGALIEELKGLGAPAGAGRSPAKTASGKYAPVLQALWIGAWNLGLARSRDDAAMLAFVERQTGLAHTRFLADSTDAAKAIEGLKAWVARDGGVTWPTQRDADEAGRPLSWLRKRAVCRAVAAKLQAAGGFAPFIAGQDVWPGDVEAYGYRRGLKAAFRFYDETDWDRLAAWFGARLRATLAGKEGARE
jgi:hypothetical protein